MIAICRSTQKAWRDQSSGSSARGLRAGARLSITPQPGAGGRGIVVTLRNLHHNVRMSSESLGQRIKQRRLEKGLTQRDLAEAAGITVPYMSKIEADRETPTDEKLERIANQLGLNADELILAAGRLPEDVMERLTADPEKALEFLRRVRK